MIALICENGLRTAAVTAKTDRAWLGLTAWTFTAFLADHPEAASGIPETMAKRVKTDASG